MRVFQKKEDMISYYQLKKIGKKSRDANKIMLKLIKIIQKIGSM